MPVVPIALWVDLDVEIPLGICRSMVTLQTGEHPGEATETPVYSLGNAANPICSMPLGTELAVTALLIYSEEPFKILVYCDKGSTHWVFPQCLLETKSQSWKSVCSNLQSQNQSHLHSVNWECVPGIRI